MLNVVRDGKPATAMKSFGHILSEKEIKQVVAFVWQTFIQKKEKNTVYHSVENGWTNHEQYKSAYPFVTGEIALDVAWEELTPSQQVGKRLYMSSCVSCHDRARVNDEGVVWQSRPLSFPRNQYSHLNGVDGVSAASPLALHDNPVVVSDKNDERYVKGKSLFEKNCTFCHGADGSGKNWIGSFIEPHPRNLSDETFLASQTLDSLQKKIAQGVEGSAMPAWQTVMSPEEISSIAYFLLSQ